MYPITTLKLKEANTGLPQNVYCFLFPFSEYNIYARHSYMLNALSLCQAYPIRTSMFIVNNS